MLKPRIIARPINPKKRKPGPLVATAECACGGEYEMRLAPKGGLFLTHPKSRGGCGDMRGYLTGATAAGIIEEWRKSGGSEDPICESGKPAREPERKPEPEPAREPEREPEPEQSKLWFQF